MKKTILFLGALFLFAESDPVATAPPVSGSSEADCMEEALLGFKLDLGVCKNIQTPDEKRECIKAAMDKVHDAQLSCRNA